MKPVQPSLQRRTLTPSISLGIALWLLLPQHSGSAAQVSADTATAAVRAWLKTDARPMGEALSAQIQQVRTFQDDAGTILYYVVELEPLGFVVMAADDLVEPIIAFSGQGHFDSSPTTPLGAMVSQDLAGRVHQAQRRALGLPSSAGLKARAKWQQLAELAPAGGVGKSQLSSVSDIRVAPLTQTTWSQATAGDYGVVACYNYYTPPYAEGNKNNYYCGCVATAMAQLMRYHQHPVTGVGTAAFTIQVDGVSQSRNLRGGDGLGGPYLWSDMVLSPTSSSTVAQRQAIGALTADAGVSVGMKYYPDGSSAVTLNAKNALVNTFHYGNGIRGYNNNSDLSWSLNNMVNPNLDARLPVLLGISGAGGHAVVGDGYGYDFGTLYYHLNLGWSGSDTAWYALPVVDTSLGTFTVVHSCVYNVYASGAGEIISGRVLDETGLAVANATVTATRQGGGTYAATTDSKGIYALSKIPDNSSYTLTVTKSGYVTASGSYWTGASMNDSLTCGNLWGADFTVSRVPNGVDHFEWSAIGSPQGANLPLAVTLTAQNPANGVASSFNGTVTLSGSVTGIASTNRILGNRTPNLYSDDYDWTEGYSFIPNATLQVTHVRSYYGDKVCIWSDSGTRLASQAVPGGNGSWVETPLATPLTLTAGTRYWVSVYYADDTRAYYLDPWPATFPQGSIGAYAYGDGDTFPDTVDTSCGPLVDLRYTVLFSNAIPVTPTISGAFVNGVWNGTVTVPQTATNLVLRAEDGDGHSGLSNPFNVVSVTAPGIGSPKRLGNGQLQFTLTGATGCNYQVLVSTDLKSWQSLYTVAMTNSSCDIRETISSQQQRFYRAKWVP